MVGDVGDGMEGREVGRDVGRGGREVEREGGIAGRREVERVGRREDGRVMFNWNSPKEIATGLVQWLSPPTEVPFTLT